MDLDHDDDGNGNCNGNGSSDERDTSDTRKGRKQYHRHTPQQIQRLEGFFKECPHPDESQRRQLSSELELEPRQVKFWFQNKRTQAKVQNERADNNSLKMENEKMQCENLAIREALKNVKCLDCMGSCFGEEEGIPNIQSLRMENVQLKQEYERLSGIVANFLGKPVEQIKSLSSSCSSSLDMRREILGLFPGGGGDGGGGGGGHRMTPELGLSLDLGIGTTSSSSSSSSTNSIFQNQLINMTARDMEKPVMIETAVNAMAELYKLLQVNEPLWTRSPADGRLTLHRESYRKLFPRSIHFNGSNARFESSKHSGLVGMSALHLLDNLLDPNKWVDLFPTIVTKARTIEVLDTRMLGEQSGLLQLIYEQMHILSPLVPPREYYFLRYCREVGSSVWMMVDVSYDQFREHLNASPLRSWKLPSGCMVQDISNGCCEVTWVEHVEVDDRSQTHRLYRDLVCGFAAYGAERWIVTLQRMSQRWACSADANSPIHALRGVIPMAPEGMKGIMDLSHRMVKDFWAMLSMSGRLDFPHISEVDNSGVRVAIRKSNEPGHPGTGAVVSAAASLWLPLSPTALFNFFADERNRVQWDVLANGNAVDEIANIPCGVHTGNCISILKPIVPKERNMLVLQESWIDPLGSALVYAPLDLPAIRSAMSGLNNINAPVLPSGLIISGDGSPDQLGSSRASTSTSSSRRSGGGCGGSLLTVAFQILVSRQTNMDTVATANGLVSSTVQRIKAALDCSDDHAD